MSPYAGFFTRNGIWNRPRRIIILGVTGSIGTQALDLVENNPDFRVVAVSARGTNPEALAAAARRADAEIVGCANIGAASSLRTMMSQRGTVIDGDNAATELAGMDADIVLNGITGAIGLRPTLAALNAGTQLALANKESLVAGGALVRAAIRRPGQVLPLDSEHSAIWQALRCGIHERGMTSELLTGRSEVSKLVLTASGGPFRGRRMEQLADVTPQQALSHPTWNMGPVVTINSATLMNKGLELIEAHLLFDIPTADIIPVVHPQSVIHSMVTFTDGATIAQASPPDMHLPIALALSYPQRFPAAATANTWERPFSWDFEPVDHETFPALRLAAWAVGASATHPAVMNAANEVCVRAFTRLQLPFTGIIPTVTEVVNEHSGIANPSLEDLEGVQHWARVRAAELVSGS
ncbi:MAG: 1-deoxy-D-xylulose-5-phosphate reductoisomerase [Varibaculum sp.]|nr:1-deoxy-D-xylulose-5-phosphate reductoisomerase [Varibaculum sp.]